MSHWFVVVLALFVASVAFAQTTSMTVGAEGRLQSMASFGPVGEPCGPYFHFTGVSKEAAGKVVGMVSFIADMTPEGGSKHIAMPMMGSDKLQVRVVTGQKVPTVKVLHSGGPVLPWLEINISPEDLKQAPCLSHSTFVGGKSAD